MKSDNEITKKYFNILIQNIQTIETYFYRLKANISIDIVESHRIINICINTTYFVLDCDEEVLNIKVYTDPEMTVEIGSLSFNLFEDRYLDMLLVSLRYFSRT